jgi:peptide/nickel transport system substrate-binding protein
MRWTRSPADDTTNKTFERPRGAQPRPRFDGAARLTTEQQLLRIHSQKGKLSMKKKTRGLAAVAVLAAAAMAIAGCATSSGGGGSSSGATPSYGAAINAVFNPSTKTGGTLKLLSATDCDSWDPARTYYGFCWNMQRLFSRTLIGYSKLNGNKFTLAPDMATNMGTHNADFTSWTYTLKSGLKYSDGSDITVADIKYAVSRLFATDVINGGPTFYFTELIDAPSTYAGPYKSGALPDSAVSTSGNSITFHLNKPFADFDYLMALPTTAPVPQSKDTAADYGKDPVSSGPFEFTDYTQNKGVTFVRNKFWKQSTDTIRHPLVNEIDFVIDSDPNDIDSKLAAGTADARADNRIGTTLQTKILTNPKIKVDADDPAGDSTNYFVVPPSVVPNQDCREAIFYATDKAAILQALGGPVSGVIAGSFTPPGIPGYSPSYNPYPVGSDNTGDITKAKAELAKCGKPNGFATKFAYATPSETAPKIFQAEQTALARVGITITAATSPASSYYSTFVGSPSNVKSQGLGIINAGWGADFPTDYGFYNNIANGGAILPEGNSNYGSINDPTVNMILDNTGAPSSQATGLQLNKALMATAIALPLSWGKDLYYRNPRLTNVTDDNALAFGIYDWVNIGVK